MKSYDVHMNASFSKLDSILVSWGVHNHMTPPVRASNLQGMDLLLSSESGPLKPTPYFRYALSQLLVGR